MNFYGPGLRAMAAASRSLENSKGVSEEERPARIFVVDDEEFVREVYRDVFESRGHTVFGAGSGEEALEVFRTMRHPPDLVIMDHRMPGKDGIQTTKDLLRLEPGLPIIFSSADESVRETAIRAGAISFWTKPFPIALLVDAMNDILDAKKRR